MYFQVKFSLLLLSLLFKLPNSPLHFLFQGTAMFLHWLVGMVYVFYFASFVLLLREVLRPGVLWFLRNLNDPDFQPVQEVRNLSLSSKKFCKIPQWNSIGICNIFFSQVSTVSSNMYTLTLLKVFFFLHLKLESGPHSLWSLIKDF